MRRRHEAGLRSGVPTLEEFWVNELDGRLQKRAQSTFNQYRWIGRDHVAPVIGNMPINAIKTVHIERVLDVAYNRPGISPTTVNTIRRVLSVFMERARKLGYIESNPVLNTDPLTIAKKRKVILAPAAVAEIFESAPSPMARALLIILVETGARISEVLGLRIEDVTEDYIHITHQAQRIGKKWKRMPTKTHAERSFPLVGGPGQRIRDALAAYDLPNYDDPKLSKLEHRWLFLNSKQTGPVSPTAVRKWFKKCLDAHKLPEMTVHNLRSTMISAYRARNVGSATVAAIVGHRNSSTTEQHYTQVLPETALKAIEDAG